MDECCAVCAEVLEWTGYGRCGHLQTCSKCVARLRFVLHDKRCAICQQESDVVFFTRYNGNFTNRITSEAFDSLSRVRDYSYLSVIQGYFDDGVHFDFIKALCSYTHPAIDAFTSDHVKFKSLREMKTFMKTNLNKQLCEICLTGRKVFVCEQILYSPADMKRHMSRGDVEGPLAEGGFKGHPICEFCRSRFFSESELFKHNTERHETCFICRQENPHIYRYFRDYTSLEEHFRSRHFPCTHPECVERRFVVFSNETDLRHHHFVEHERNNPNSVVSRAQRRDALTIETNFQFSRPAVRGGRGNRRFQPEARQEYEIDHRGAEVEDFSENFGQRMTLTEADFPEFVSQSISTPAQARWPVGGHRQGAGLRQDNFPSLPGQSSDTKGGSQDKNRKKGVPTMAERVAPKPPPKKKPVIVQPMPNPNLKPLSGIKNSASMPQLVPEDDPPPDTKTSWVTLSKLKTQDDFPMLGDRSTTISATSSWRPKPPPTDRSKEKPIPSKTTKTSISDTNAFPSLGRQVQSTTKSEKPQEKKPKISEGLRAAHKVLLRTLKSQMDGLTFEAFHQASENFVHDRVATDKFHDLLVEFGLAHFIAEIAKLCPNISKRTSLLEVHGNFIEQCKKDPSSASISVPLDVLLVSYKSAMDRLSWLCSKCSTMNISDADFCETCDAPKTNGNEGFGNTNEGNYRRDGQRQSLFAVENGGARNRIKNPWERNRRP